MEFLTATWWMIFSPCLLEQWPVILGIWIALSCYAELQVATGEFDFVEASNFLGSTCLFVACFFIVINLFTYAATSSACRWPI